MKLRFTLLALGALVAFMAGCLDVNAQEPPVEPSGMKIMFGGNLNIQSVAGGAQGNFLLPLGGRFFALAQGEFSQASSGFDDDGYGRAYGVDAVLGADLLNRDRWRLALTGGIANQWYAFVQLTDPESVQDLDDYVVGSLGMLGFWRPRVEYELFIHGHYYNPVKDNAISSGFKVVVGLAVPIG